MSRHLETRRHTFHEGENRGFGRDILPLSDNEKIIDSKIVSVTALDRCGSPIEPRIMFQAIVYRIEFVYIVEVTDP